MKMIPLLRAPPEICDNPRRFLGVAVCSGVLGGQIVIAEAHCYCRAIFRWYQNMFAIPWTTFRPDIRRGLISPRSFTIRGVHKLLTAKQSSGVLPCVYPVALDSVRESSGTLPVPILPRVLQRSAKNSVGSDEPNKCFLVSSSKVARTSKTESFSNPT